MCQGTVSTFLSVCFSELFAWRVSLNQEQCGCSTASATRRHIRPALMKMTSVSAPITSLRLNI